VVHFQAGARDLHIIRKVQTAVGAHPVSYSLSTRVSFSRVSCPGMNLITHIHPVLRLRINGAIPSLPYVSSVRRVGTDSSTSVVCYQTHLTVKLATLLFHTLNVISTRQRRGQLLWLRFSIVVFSHSRTST
jgi:hypothetical protein